MSLVGLAACTPTPSEVTTDAVSASGTDGTTHGPATLGDTTVEDSSGTGPDGPICGDGLTEGNEACDLGDLNGTGDFCRNDCMLNTCGDGYVGPSEACDDGNTDDDDECTNGCGLASCGDGVVQPPEQCDEGRANSQTGACLPSCFSASCGDQFIYSMDEACDGPNTRGRTCMTEGFDGGNLLCAADCQDVDTSECFRCGNGVVEENSSEECDMADFGGQSCSDFAPGGTTPSGGALVCGKDCTIDPGPCSYCGDAVREGDEDCDGVDLGGASCSSVDPAFDDGELTCSMSCSFVTTACTDCGDGMIEGNEDCDSDDLGGASCLTLGMGFDDGVLACNNGTCSFDLSDCSECGNDTIEGSEVCDGTDVGAETCQSVDPDFGGGSLGCLPGCGAFDTGSCCLDLGAMCMFDATCCSGNCNNGNNTCVPT